MRAFLFGRFYAAGLAVRAGGCGQWHGAGAGRQVYFAPRDYAWRGWRRGRPRVSGFLEGEDCLATMRAFQAMGVEIVHHGRRG